MGWRVADVGHAPACAVALVAEAYQGTDKALDLPAIVGIGGSLIYFTDRYGDANPYGEFEFVSQPKPVGVGFHYLDHLTHNVHKGNMNKWFDFYERLFNLRQIRFFDIAGKFTGLHSRALTSPCGRIRIPINEDRGETGQIVEYLKRYNGEGIQHIAVGTDDLNGAVDEIAAHGILIDGEGVVDGGETRILLQIFSKTMVGPIFFEFIQRKGDDGFGEGNFRALFESIEQDQIDRGVLKAS